MKLTKKKKKKKKGSMEKEKKGTPSYKKHISLSQKL